VTGTLPTANGGTNLTSFTSGGVVYASSSSALATGSALTFDGTNLGIGTTSPAYKLDLYTTASFAGKWANATRGGYLYLDSGGPGIFNTAAYGGEGMYFHAGSNYIQFVTNSAESVRITSAGNVGIGTTSPSSYGKLAVRGTVSMSYGNCSAQFSDATTGSLHILHSSGLVSVSSDTGLAFGTGSSATERARINSDGQFLLGTTSAFNSAYTMSLKVAGATGGLIIQPASDGYTAIQFNNAASTGVGSISVSSTLTTYNVSSDYRLKDITGPITTSGAYIDSLNPVEGTWKLNGSTFVGLIAHEVQEASRTTVATGTKDGAEMQGMDYSSAEIIANLIAEVKSLRVRVAQLETN
jgi:hypothetical protein